MSLGEQYAYLLIAFGRKIALGGIGLSRRFSEDCKNWLKCLVTQQQIVQRSFPKSETEKHIVAPKTAQTDLDRKMQTGYFRSLKRLNASTTTAITSTLHISA